MGRGGTGVGGAKTRVVSYNSGTNWRKMVLGAHPVVGVLCFSCLWDVAPRRAGRAGPRPQLLLLRAGAGWLSSSSYVDDVDRRRRVFRLIPVSSPLPPVRLRRSRTTFCISRITN